MQMHLDDYFGARANTRTEQVNANHLRVIHLVNLLLVLPVLQVQSQFPGAPPETEIVP